MAAITTITKIVVSTNVAAKDQTIISFNQLCFIIKVRPKQVQH